MTLALVLAVALGAAPSPEAIAARGGPILFGAGDTTYLLLPPYLPGDTLTVVTVRLSHAEISAGRSWDDSSYRYQTPAPDGGGLRASSVQHVTGNVWRFGADLPEGRKVFEGVRADVVRVEKVSPGNGRGLAYRGFGSAERLYLVHAGKAFVQVVRTQPASELELPAGGVDVQLDRPGQTPATRLLPGETAQARVGAGHVVRLNGQAELWFLSG